MGALGSVVGDELLGFGNVSRSYSGDGVRDIGNISSCRVKDEVLYSSRSASRPKRFAGRFCQRPWLTLHIIDAIHPAPSTPHRSTKGC
jgi:hypothetical protein